MTDTQIKEEAFLEDVDGLLNAGEVPNLFALDERAEIIEVLGLGLGLTLIIPILHVFVT